MQGPERQGLRRHLPSRSFVRAELRDEESYRATELRFWNMFSLFIWSWKNRKGSREASEACAGKIERLREIKRQVVWVLKINTPHHARLPACLPRLEPEPGPAGGGGGARARVACLYPFLIFSI